jgi:hypothetical protein
MYHQAVPIRTGSSAGSYRTFFYLGAISAAAANGAFLADRADTPGLHHLALFLGPCAVLFLAVTLADRSLRRIGGSKDAANARRPRPRACRHLHISISRAGSGTLDQRKWPAGRRRTALATPPP